MVSPAIGPNVTVSDRQITVFLADDNLIVREGVRALIGLEPDLTVVGVAADYDGLVAGAEAAAPQVVVTDIRMPPTFQQEGIDAAKEVRKRHPGTGVVVLSQYDDPEYAIALLREGSAATPTCSRTGWPTATSWPVPSATWPPAARCWTLRIVEALVNPVASHNDLTPAEEQFL